MLNISHNILLTQNSSYKQFIEKNNLQNENSNLLESLAKNFQKDETFAQAYLEEYFLILEKYPNLFNMHEKTKDMLIEKFRTKIQELSFIEESKGLSHLILDNDGEPVLDLSEFIVYLSKKYDTNFEDLYDGENETFQLTKITRTLLGFLDQEIETAKKHDIKTKDICCSIGEILVDNFTIPTVSVKQMLKEQGFYKEINDLIDFDILKLETSDLEMSKFKELMIKELENISFLKPEQTTFKAYISF